MAGGGGGPIMRAVMADQTPAPGGAEYTEAPTRATYQPAFSSQQAPMQTGPTTGGPGIGPVDLKPNAGPSSFTPMGIMANDPVSQFGDKPPITAPPQQMMRQQPMSPLVQQQMMSRQMGPQNFQGLQGLLSQMMARYQNPQQMMQRAPMQQYRSSALSYRPNMTNAQQNLSRVAKSVILQQKEAAEAELAAMKEAQAAAQQDNSYYSGGG